jgi:hypothetical protein
MASRLALLRLVRGLGDVVLALRVLCFAAVVPAIMRRPLPRVEQLIAARRASGHAAAPEHVARVAALVLAVLQAGRPLVRRGCVTRGVTLYHFLREQGVDVQLCFGMGGAAGEDDVFGDGFDGHCWVVQAGAPLLEARDPRPRYTVLWTMPAGARAGAAARPTPHGEGSSA